MLQWLPFDRCQINRGEGLIVLVTSSKEFGSCFQLGKFQQECWCPTSFKKRRLSDFDIGFLGIEG